MNDTFAFQNIKDQTPTFGQEQWRNRILSYKSGFETIPNQDSQTRLKDPEEVPRFIDIPKGLATIDMQSEQPLSQSVEDKVTHSIEVDPSQMQSFSFVENLPLPAAGNRKNKFIPETEISASTRTVDSSVDQSSNPTVSVHPKISKRSPLFQKFGHNINYPNNNNNNNDQLLLRLKSPDIKPPSQSDRPLTIDSIILPTSNKKALWQLQSQSIVIASQHPPSNNILSNQSFAQPTGIAEINKQTPVASNQMASIWPEALEQQQQQQQLSSRYSAGYKNTMNHNSITTTPGNGTSRKNSDASFSSSVRPHSLILPHIKNSFPGSPTQITSSKSNFSNQIPRTPKGTLDFDQLRESYSVETNRSTKLWKHPIPMLLERNPLQSRQSNNRSISIDSSLVPTPFKAQSPIKRNRYDLYSDPSVPTHSAFTSAQQHQKTQESDISTYSSKNITLDDVKINPIPFIIMPARAGSPETSSITRAKQSFDQKEHGPFRSNRIYSNGIQAPSTAQASSGKDSFSYDIIIEKKQKLQSANQTIRAQLMKARDGSSIDALTARRNILDLSNKSPISIKQSVSTYRKNLRKQNDPFSPDTFETNTNVPQSAACDNRQYRSESMNPSTNLEVQSARSSLQNTERTLNNVLQNRCNNTNNFLILPTQSPRAVSQPTGTVGQTTRNQSIVSSVNQAAYQINPISKRYNKQQRKYDLKTTSRFEIVNPPQFAQTKRKITHAGISKPNQQEIENLYNPDMVTRLKDKQQTISNLSQQPCIITEQICSKIQGIFQKQKDFYDHSIIHKSLNPDESFLLKELNTALEEIKGIPNTSRKQS